MGYSNSTFTLEVSGVAAVVFQAKWHSDADKICRAWVQQHWDQLRTNGRHGSELPAVIKLRLARAQEKVAYNSADDGAEDQDGVKIVALVDVKNRPWACLDRTGTDDGEH